MPQRPSALPKCSWSSKLCWTWRLKNCAPSHAIAGSLCQSRCCGFEVPFALQEDCGDSPLRQSRSHPRLARLHLVSLNSDFPFQKALTENIGYTIRPVKSDETRQCVCVSSWQAWLVLLFQPPPGCAPIVSCNVHQDVGGTTLIAKCDQDCKEFSRGQLPQRSTWKGVSISAALSTTV